VKKPAQSDNKTTQLGESNIAKLIAQYATPTILAMMVQAAYDVVNMSFIGQSVGPLGIAAIAICSPITMIQYTLVSFLANGCIASVAIKLGEGNPESARETFGSTLAFCLTISTCVALTVTITIDPLLRLFGASEAVLPYARDFLRINTFSAVFSVFLILNPLIRIEGYPTLSMLATLLSTAVHLCVAPTLIFVFEMGVRGAAIGTLCANIAVGIWVFSFMRGKKRVVRLQFRYLRYKLHILKIIMQLGLPTFLMQLSQTLLSVVMNRSLIAYGGDISMSAWGITNNITMLINQPIFGMTQGAQPIIGYNIGARKHIRVKKALMFSLMATSLFAILGWSLTQLFPVQLFSFYSDDPGLISLGVRMFTTFRALVFVIGIQQAGSSYFQYSGRPKVSALLSLSRQVLILIPCVLLLPLVLGFDGILYSGPISDFVSTTITALFIIFEFRRLNKLIRSEG